MLAFLRTKTVPHRHAEAGTWLELFFDLVYVATLVELGNRLSHDISLEGVLQFLFLFVIVWWSWLDKVFYNRSFPNDNIGQRFLVFLYMALMGMMAFNIHDITGSTAANFLLAYAASKFILVLMYVKAWRRYPQYRPMTRIYIVGFSVATIAWLAIALFAPTNFLSWALLTGVGIALQVVLSIVQSRSNQPSFEMPTMKKDYMRHRFGELTIIVLGEFFIKVIASASEREVYLVTLLYFFLLLSISSGLWWLYFDHLEHSSLAKRRSLMEVWIYIHYPLLAAISAYGVVGNKVMALIPGEALSDPKRWLFCGALATAIACTAVIEWAMRERAGAMSRRPQTLTRILGAIVLIVLALLGGGLGVPLMVAIVAVIIISLVGLDISWRLRNPVTAQAKMS
ncbi:low temperature requirement protein A [Chloroflexota bacterium]